MPEVQVRVEPSEEHLRRSADAAQRQGVAVEQPIERTVSRRIDERERDRLDGTEHPAVVEHPTVVVLPAVVVHPAVVKHPTVVC